MVEVLMDDMPDLWWSPTHGLIKREDGLCWLLTNGPLLEDGDAPLPADAVRLRPDRITDYDYPWGEEVS
jgi:hypothetical protein